jgi:hypothetical protein
MSIKFKTPKVKVNTKFPYETWGTIKSINFQFDYITVYDGTRHEVTLYFSKEKKPRIMFLAMMGRAYKFKYVAEIGYPYRGTLRGIREH